MIPMADADIKALVAGNPAYTDITIPADTYAMGTPPVVTFGTWAILVGSQDLDDDTVSVIMSALTTHRERLRNAHPALSAFSLKSTLPEALDIPLHPGAAKFPSE
jgi:TRAP transporter TAXI family solute receptor